MFHLSSNIPAFQNSKRGFTLIELMIAMSIFAVMSVMMINIYIQTTTLSRKLNYMRQLSETAREVTERISEDVRKNGMSLTAEFDTSGGAYPLWTDQAQYALSGSEYLQIQSGGMYVYGAKTSTGIKPCIDTLAEKTKTDAKIHCGLYRVQGDDYYNLVDSFIPEESKKRIKINNLRFYVSGGEFTDKKVTISFTLSLMPRSGISTTLISDTELHIQTTISEQNWKR